MSQRTSIRRTSLCRPGIYPLGYIFVDFIKKVERNGETGLDEIFSLRMFTGLEGVYDGLEESDIQFLKSLFPKSTKDLDLCYFKGFWKGFHEINSSSPRLDSEFFCLAS